MSLTERPYTSFTFVTMPVLFGRIKFYNPKSNFGFINQLNSGNDFYFHIKKPTEELFANDIVSFEIKETKKGFEAINVRKTSSAPTIL